MADVVYPYTITDAAGRRVIIDRPLQKIISLNRQTSECIVALGAAEKIIATGDATVRNNPYLYLGHLPEIGATGAENIEAIIALNPDAVFAYSSRSPYIDVQLDGSGIKVIRIDNNKYGTEDSELLLLGKLLERQDAAADLLEWKKNLRQIASQKLKLIDDKDQLTVAAFSLGSVHSQGAFKLFPVSTADGGRGPGEAHSAILAGGRDAFPGITQDSAEASLTVLINEEYLLKQNPQAITFHGSIFGGYDGPDGQEIQAIFDGLKRNSCLVLTEAGQKNRFYFFHTDLTGGNKRDIGVLQLMKYLYPQIMNDIEPIDYLKEYFTHRMGCPFNGTWFYADGDL